MAKLPWSEAREAGRLDRWKRSSSEIEAERTYADATLRFFAECKRVRLFEDRWGGLPDEDRRAEFDADRQRAGRAWFDACPEIQHLERKRCDALVKLKASEGGLGGIGSDSDLAEHELAAAAVMRCELLVLQRQARDKFMLDAFQRRKGRFG